MSIGRVPGVTGIQPSIVDAKGDLIVATAADSVDRLAVGANNTVLTADSATATGLKWATPSTPNFVGAFAYSNANLTVATGTFTAVTMGAEYFDTDNFHSTSSNTSRMTIPSGKGGKYLVIAGLLYQGGTTGQRRILIYKNGANFVNQQTGSATSEAFPMNISHILDLAAGDYVELFAYHTQGTNLIVYSSAIGDGSITYLGLEYLGA